MSEGLPAAGGDPAPTTSTWRRDLASFRRRPARPRPLTSSVYLLALIMVGAGALLSATLFALYLDLAISPGELDVPPPRPGSEWATHVVVWRAGVILLGLLVAALIFAMAFRALVRHGRAGLVNCRGGERLALLAAPAAVFAGSLVFLFRELTGVGSVPSPWSTARIVAVAGAGLLAIIAGEVGLRLDLVSPSRRISFGVGLGLAGLCILAGGALFADFSRSGGWPPLMPQAAAQSGSYPSGLLDALAGQAFTETPFGSPDWASIGFAAWTPTNPDLPVETSTPDCLESSCLVLGNGYGGSEALGLLSPARFAWGAGAIPPYNPIPSSLACGDPQLCLVTMFGGGSKLLATSDGGGRWVPVALPMGLVPLLDPFGETTACDRSGQCEVLATSTFSVSAQRRCGCEGRTVLVTSAGAFPPSHWHVEPIPLPLSGENGQDELFGLTCPTPRDCLAAGALGTRGLVFRTDNGGRSWKEASLPSGTPGLSQLACSDLHRCVAVGSVEIGRYSAGVTYVGSVLLVTRNGGISWQRVPLSLAGKVVLTNVGCSPVGPCVAAGEAPSAGPRGLQPAGALVVLRTSDLGTAAWSSEATVPRGRFSVTGAGCSARGCLVTAAQFDSSTSATLFSGSTFDFDLSPASTGVVIWFSPSGRFHLEQLPPLPPAAVQPVVDPDAP